MEWKYELKTICNIFVSLILLLFIVIRYRDIAWSNSFIFFVLLLVVILFNNIFSYKESAKKKNTTLIKSIKKDIFDMTIFNFMIIVFVSIVFMIVIPQILDSGIIFEIGGI